METVATELRYLCVGGRVCPRSYLRLARARTHAATPEPPPSSNPVYSERRASGLAGEAVCDTDTPRGVGTFLQPSALPLRCGAFASAPAATSSSSSLFTFFSSPDSAASCSQPPSGQIGVDGSARSEDPE